jgi:hypothetical protein
MNLPFGMYFHTTLKNRMNINELLVECLDALSSSEGSTEEHCRLIQVALDTQKLAKNDRNALTRLRTRLNLHVSGIPWSMFNSNEERLNFKQSITNELTFKNLPEYVYHGTIARHLKSIAEIGLQPGKSPVWSGKGISESVRKSSDSGVFFTDSWRVAMGNWAYMAHRKSRGPKAGANRKPVVIRINRAKLILERDPLALSASLMVKGSVAVHDAEIIMGFDVGLPEWVPLHLAARSTN